MIREINLGTLFKLHQLIVEVSRRFLRWVEGTIRDGRYMFTPNGRYGNLPIHTVTYTKQFVQLDNFDHVSLFHDIC